MQIAKRKILIIIFYMTIIFLFVNYQLQVRLKNVENVNIEDEENIDYDELKIVRNKIDLDYENAADYKLGRIIQPNQPVNKTFIQNSSVLENCQLLIIKTSSTSNLEFFQNFFDIN